MILIKNLTRSSIDKKFLEIVAERTLKNLPKSIKKGKTVEIDLAVIGEKRMRSLNRNWRKKDKATDVLSFGSEKGESKIKFISPIDNIIHLGQIFICYPVAVRQARVYGSTVKGELARLLVHGILHLAGYDHEKSASEEKVMMGLQEKILEKKLKKR